MQRAVNAASWGQSYKEHGTQLFVELYSKPISDLMVVDRIGRPTPLRRWKTRRKAIEKLRLDTAGDSPD